MAEPASETYYCPMHPSVRQQGPGTCPKCGMTLFHEDTRFAIVHHVMSRPLHHILIGAATVVATLVVLLLVVRRGF
jgi:hypothetical protein